MSNQKTSKGAAELFTVTPERRHINRPTKRLELTFVIKLKGDVELLAVIRTAVQSIDRVVKREVGTCRVNSTTHRLTVNLTTDGMPKVDGAYINRMIDLINRKAHEGVQQHLKLSSLSEHAAKPRATGRVGTRPNFSG